MTEYKIRKAILATKFIISKKPIGEKAKYPMALKESILMAAAVIGVNAFAKEAGIRADMISRWKRLLRTKKNLKINRNPGKNTPLTIDRKMASVVPSCAIDNSLSPVRELMVIQNTPINEKSGFAKIKAGGQLEIEVPLALLTPEWVSTFIRSVNTDKDVRC